MDARGSQLLQVQDATFDEQVLSHRQANLLHGFSLDDLDALCHRGPVQGGRCLTGCREAPPGSGPRAHAPIARWNLVERKPAGRVRHVLSVRAPDVGALPRGEVAIQLGQPLFGTRTSKPDFTARDGCARFVGQLSTKADQGLQPVVHLAELTRLKHELFRLNNQRPPRGHDGQAVGLPGNQLSEPALSIFIADLLQHHAGDFHPSSARHRQVRLDPHLCPHAGTRCVMNVELEGHRPLDFHHDRL